MDIDDKLMSQKQRQGLTDGEVDADKGLIMVNDGQFFYPFSDQISINWNFIFGIIWKTVNDNFLADCGTFNMC